MSRVAVLALVTGCRIHFGLLPEDGDAGTTDGDGVIAGGDAAADAALGTGPFGLVSPVDEINVGGPADDVTLTGDRNEMFFNSSRAPNQGGEDIWTATFNAVGDWVNITSVTSLNTSGDDATPDVSRDGLTMYLVADGSVGMKDVFVATRADRTSAWGGKTQITAVSTAADESGPTVTPDGLTMYLSANPSGDDDLYVATRPTVNGAWSAPMLVTGVNSPSANDAEPFINDTNTVLLFASDRGGNFDIYRSTRATPSDPWGAPVPVSELNTGGAERDPWLSPDEKTIYFARDTSLYIAIR